MIAFHDEDYDGIVLKIHRGIIATNPELLEKIKDFKKALKDCKFSTLMPDHQKSIFELENYTEKKDIKADRDKRDSDLKNIRLRQEERRLSHKEIPLEKDAVAYNGTHSHIIKLGDDTLTDLYTRTGFKSHIKPAVKEYLKKLDSKGFRQFLDDNGFYIPNEWITPLFDINTCEIYLDNYSNITLRVYVIRANFYLRGKRKKENIYYQRRMLEYDSKLEKYFIGGEVSPFIKSEKMPQGTGYNCRTYFDNYEFNNTKTALILKEDGETN